MKKLIALASFSMSFCFALALANADDTYSESNTQHAMEKKANTLKEQAGEHAGTMKESSKSTTTESTTSSTTGTTDETQEKNKTPPSMSSTDTCTDKSGNTLHRSDKGYDQCIKMMKKHKQMGGQASDASRDKSIH